jgi:ectoine hydroxylase-related dioxygenase (phytanoyl-CoA dioxygenase family)
LTATDLSLNSIPIGGFFKPPQSKSDWDAFRLSDEQIAFYYEHGYLPKVKILEAEQIEKLRVELATFFDPGHVGRELWYEYHTNESGDPNNVLFHALGAWRIAPGFHDLLWHPSFVMAASQLLGVNGKQVPVRFWHDQLFCKPAKHGGVVAWHQDYSYWTRTTPMQHLTCWIGLDDSTVANGCVHYVPGSHRWNLLPITGLAGDMAAIKEVLTPEEWDQFQKPVAVELKAGEATFHHPLMVHGSFANRTDRPRRAAVVNVFADGVKSASSDELLKGVPPIPPGQPMQGRYFPLLFDQSSNV